MRCILVAADAETAQRILELPGWHVRFDEVCMVPLPVLARRYQAVVPTDFANCAPLVTEGSQIALLCTDLSGFERITKWAPPADILFMPSAVARLDMAAAGRLTLTAARPLARGAVIARADLATEHGGLGLGVDWIDRVVDRRVMYDLARGAPIDFGMLGETTGKI
jgi:hypothetical protein